MGVERWGPKRGGAGEVLIDRFKMDRKPGAFKFTTRSPVRFVKFMIRASKSTSRGTYQVRLVKE